MKLLLLAASLLLAQTTTTTTEPAPHWEQGHGTINIIEVHEYVDSTGKVYGAEYLERYSPKYNAFCSGLPASYATFTTEADAQSYVAGGCKK